MATVEDDGDRQVTERPISRTGRPGRRRFQFSLGLLLAVVAGIGALLAFILHYPTLAIVLAIIAVGIVVVGGLFALLLAEAIFEDWLASKLNSDQKQRSEMNDH